jgi:hypothetical protein
VNIAIDYIGGNCPVQAEGTIDGKPFYFRARGEHWSLGIGGEPIGEPEWEHCEEYPGELFEAGWMSQDEARGFIEKGVDIYRIWRDEPDDDGQPTEAQEWRDYDPDC